MNISETQDGIKWLRQFTVYEVYLARMLLDSLKLISFTECERGIANALEKICTRTIGTVALFTIDKKIIDKLSSLPGSEQRLAHLLRNIHRQFPDRVLINPDVETMRMRRVKHIVMVDDLICSGQRLDDFWDVWGSADQDCPRIRMGKKKKLTKRRGSVRSWLSFHYCKLWIVAYAIHEVGLSRLLRRVPYLTPDCCVSELTLRQNVKYWPDKVSDLLVYARPEFSYGWGNFQIPIIFQHGCPDNCPRILWENGSHFRGIFPNRAVPTGLYPCFQGYTGGRFGPSLLISSGQSRLAMALIEKIVNGKGGKKYTDILLVLGLILGGHSPGKLGSLLLMEESRIRELIETARQLSLLSEDLKVTGFGRDIVERTRKSFLTSEAGRTTVPSVFYIPKQFQNRICGAQRKSRNEPETTP